MFMPNVKKAYEIARKIKDNFEKREFQVANATISKTISIGLAYHRSTNGPTPWQVIKQADVALYKAKEGGRNKIEIFSKDEEE